MRNRIALIFFSLILSFYIGNYAKGADVLDQSYSTYVNLNILYSDGWTVVGQRFTPLYNNISKIKIYTNGSAGGGNVELSICQGTPNNLSTADVKSNLMTCNWLNNTRIFNETFTNPCSGGSSCTFQLTTPVGLTAGNPYYFGVTIGTSTASQIKPKYNSHTNDGNAHDMVLTGSQWLNSLVYEEYYSDTYTPPSGYYLFILNPLDGFVTASSTVNFISYYEQPDLSYNAYFWLIVNDRTGAEVGGYNRIASTSGTTSFKQVLVDGTYNWSTFFYDENLGVIATSTSESFTVNSLGTFSFDNPLGLTEGEICEGIATSTGITDLHIFGDIECGLKKFGLWALYPSQLALVSLDEAYEEIKLKFPFSAYFGLTDAVTNVIATTTLTSTGGFSVPMINTSGDFYMLPVLASTSMPNAIGQTNTDLFRNSIKWLLWLSAGFLIIIQFKKI
jgi:hypothetical protein